jgi:hypothetical protein
MKWWLLSSLIVLSACGNNEAADNSLGNDSTTGVHAGASDTIVHSTIALQDGCYEMIMKRDTATLTLQIQDTTIVGDLNFRWAEKDHNKGRINGYIKDSLLIADYTFESEGMTSIREIVFKLQGDTLLQGFGELEEQNGKVLFKQKEQLQYNMDFPFIKVDCAHLHK